MTGMQHHLHQVHGGPPELELWHHLDHHEEEAGTIPLPTQDSAALDCGAQETESQVL